jgi:serine/threonine-protein kinase
MVAGTLGYVAFRPGLVSSGAPQPALSVGVAPPAVVPEPPRPAVAMVKVRVNTEPDGAGVKEDGVELCSSTPCDILYKGPDADPARDHKLTVARPGYRSETRSVKVTEGSLTVKLSKVDPPRFVPPPAVKPDMPVAPTGYKTDVPY